MYRVSRQSVRRQREAGAALVEMVFVLVPLLAVIFLLVDTAWLIFARASLQDAVRQAVRFGVVGQLAPGCSGLNASILQVIQQHSQGFVNAGNVASVVTIRYTSPTDSTTTLTGCTASAGGNVLQVSIAGFALKPMAPLLRSASALSLSANSSDVMEPGINSCP